MEYAIAILESIWIVILVVGLFVIVLIIFCLIVSAIDDWIEDRKEKKNEINEKIPDDYMDDLFYSEKEYALKKERRRLEEFKYTFDKVKDTFDKVKDTINQSKDINQWPDYLKSSNQSQWTSTKDKYKDARKHSTYFPNWITDIDIQREWGNDISVGIDIGWVDWGMISWVYKKIPLANEEKIIKTEPSIYL